MRRFVIAVVMALGLVALWAALLPLTAQPAPAATTQTDADRVMSKALFLCRGPHGLNQACVAALAKALVAPDPQQAADNSCRAEPQMVAELSPRD